MQVDVDVTVERPVAEVFDAMADARNEPSWNSQVSRCELRSDPPIGEGSRFLTVNRGNQYDAVITRHDRPGRLAFTVSGKVLVITATLDFAEAAPASTRLTGTFDLQPRSFMKVLLPLIGPSVRKDFPKQLASFKAFCESRG